ncbi:MAG: hypothetical protein JJU05_14320 [Verrucomicrobia bacterium]|nr:hypothetical protein [Verrucomicrobiota bacterium]
MRLSTLRISVLFLACMTVPFLQAQTGVTGKIATSGFGFDVTRDVAETINLRIGYNRLGIITGYDFDDNLRLNLQLESIPVLLDWHLLDSSFRLTGGLFYNRNRFTLSARGNDVVDVNNTRYRVESYSVNVSVNDFTPYLGFGWGRANDPAQRLAFAFDIGIMFQGDPSVSGRAVAFSSDAQERLDSDFDAELASRRSDLSDLKYYPLISIGLSYRF